MKSPSRHRPVTGSAPTELRRGNTLLVVSLDDLRALHDEWLAECHAEPPAPAAVDTTTACRAIGVSKPTMLRLAEQGAPHFMVGEHRRWVLADLLTWLKSRALRNGEP